MFQHVGVQSQCLYILDIGVRGQNLNLQDLHRKIAKRRPWGVETWRSNIVWSNYCDLTRPGPPHVGLVREMGPLISGKSRLVKYYNLASNIVFNIEISSTQQQ